MVSRTFGAGSISLQSGESSMIAKESTSTPPTPTNTKLIFNDVQGVVSANSVDFFDSTNPSTCT
jgi:hypothetical protein